MKRTISARGRLGLLQIVSEPNIGRCASEEAELRREVDTRWCVSKDAGPRRVVDWGVPHRLEKETSVSKDSVPRSGVDCEIAHRLGEENEAFFVRV